MIGLTPYFISGIKSATSADPMLGVWIVVQVTCNCNSRAPQPGIQQSVGREGWSTQDR